MLPLLAALIVIQVAPPNEPRRAASDAHVSAPPIITPHRGGVASASLAVRLADADDGERARSRTPRPATPLPATSSVGLVASTGEHRGHRPLGRGLPTRAAAPQRDAQGPECPLPLMPARLRRILETDVVATLAGQISEDFVEPRSRRGSTPPRSARRRPSTSSPDASVELWMRRARAQTRE